MANILINANLDKNGIEVVIADNTRLSASDKAILDSLNFKWHRTGKYYYAKYDEKKYEELLLAFADRYHQSDDMAKTVQKIKAQMKTSEKVQKSAAKKSSKKTSKKSDSKTATKVAVDTKASTKSSEMTLVDEIPFSDGSVMRIFRMEDGTQKNILVPAKQEQNVHETHFAKRSADGKSSEKISVPSNFDTTVQKSSKKTTEEPKAEPKAQKKSGEVVLNDGTVLKPSKKAKKSADTTTSSEVVAPAISKEQAEEILKQISALTALLPALTQIANA